MFIPMELSRVLILDSSPEQFITLSERGGGGRSFAIRIGTPEAVAIDRRLRGEPPPRPQTHELIENVVAALGAEIVRVEIHSLEGGTYFANVVLAQGGREIAVDARPSDAVALAVARRLPIEVDEQVLADSAEERPDVEPPVESDEDADDA